MSDATQISGTEAIRRVIENGTAVDYIDVVHEVKKRFRLDVTSADVEQVFHDLATEKSRPSSRVSMAMTTERPEQSLQTDAALPKSTQPSQTTTEDLEHALHFVQSVQGLTNAKRLLAELEAILLK